ncbi:DNA mismatch repair endonuclease MutL [Paucilactobacillus nenjiangensis]|uniref:DNA mismatch repair endonuclease MutL n=1 Tax=Paucilactobacillus nenjiangensis TaxID=1296540 RepID=UPI0028D738C2|nr:DNA mismatch repair endonuclease MutL [Paucilactobacillus nenjiangensis]
MAKIHELTEVLADQIAAGEVIERPASIVKELVENSVDAHSRQIDIIVENSGFDSIRIIDDGDGIESDDVLTAFKRHATSKISSRQDLFKVASLGFRGEALPSIASVSDVTMITSNGTDSGTEINIRGGEIIKHSVAAVRQGTDIFMKDLFFNTPARLKYLKSPQTELSQITDIVDRLALGNPDVAITFTHNQHEILRTAGNGNLQQVIAAIYGISNARQMVDFENEDADFRVTGYTSLPAVTRASRQYITILINRRYIRNYQLTRSIIQGYGSKLMVGRYPISVINIELDPILVDVNVHPAKREVRISKEDQLGQLIATALQESIAQENLIPDALGELNTEEKVDFDDLKSSLNDASSSYTAPKITTQETADPTIVEPVAPITIVKSDELTDPLVKNFDEKYHAETGVSVFGDGQPEPEVEHQQENLELDLNDKTDRSKERFPELQFIGQFRGTFLLASAADGLYLVDQHAAQERINYEYYREEIGKVSEDAQTMLVPIVLDYPTADAMMIMEHMEVLKSLGLELEPFGQNSFVVHQHPTWFKQGQEESTIREMVDWIITDGHLTVAQFREKTAIMMSCKRAIKANHYLNDDQAKALLVALPKCENPFNCPHGRPVVIQFSEPELEKMFKRIQDSHSAYAGEFNDHEF